MCGISGEIRFDDRPADLGAVGRITDHLAARGPDGSGLWSSGSIGLGHRRLAIIDLSHRGDQPMVDPELGLTIVFNGCIYNYRALRAELEGHGYRFFSTSDTEVILKGFHRWGLDVVDRLIGMFAFAIAERDTGRCVLARDRLGVKPLYLSDQGDCLRFASTLPALVAGGGVDQRIDPIGLHHYLTFHAVVPAPRTILRGVTKLPPATTLVVEPDGTRHERTYWDPVTGHGGVDRPTSADEWSEAVGAALRLAVERRLVADVPVGVLLSGGLDSSLIVALLAEAGQEKLSTFSIGFESVGNEEGNEFRWSDQVADRYQTDHHRIPIPTDQVLASVPAAIAAMSEPMVSHDVVAFHLLSEEVARTIKVVQSGQGADEVFGGYHWYQTLDELERGIYPLTRAEAVAAYAGVFFDRRHQELTGVVADAYLQDADVSTAFVADHFARRGPRTTVDRALRIDTQVMLVEDPVKRVDNMTMAFGLEARVPFLDHELVELAFACPTDLLLAGGGKGIVKDLARSVLPGDLIDRPKGYFPVPPLVQLGPEAVTMLGDALGSAAARDRGLFRRGHVEHLLAHPQELTALKYNQLWELGVLELWLQTHGIG